MVRVLIANLRHGSDETLAGILADAHPHFLAERDMIVPGLLQLAAPVWAMQNIVQRRHRFNHQEVADRGGLRRGDLALINKAKLGKERHRIFTGATHYPFYPFLACHGFQRHRHQRAEAFVLHRRVDRHKADRRFVVGIDIQPPYSDNFTALIHHHLMVRHGVVGILFRTHRLVQWLAQHFPTKLVIILQLLFCYGYS
ncbi:hypothetical protein D3C80_1401490 [compost metagenome]